MRAPFSKAYLLAAAAVIIFSACPVEATAQEKATLNMSHQKIEVNSFYHGTNLVVSGTAPAHSRLALVVEGEKKDLKLNRKGRVGPLWMNVGVVAIEGAPEMYYLFTSTPEIDQLGCPENLGKCNIGYDVLGKSVTIKQDDADHDLTFREFIKLKENMGLYKCSLDSIKVELNNGNTEKFSVTIPIPPLVPQGEFKVALYCFNEDPLFTNSTGTLIVEKTGLPQMLSGLAYSHPAVYGVLAIVVAIAAGLSMGVLFGGKQKGGH